MPGEQLKRKSWLNEKENVATKARMADVAMHCSICGLRGCWLAKDDEPQMCSDCEKTACPKVAVRSTANGICISHQRNTSVNNETQTKKKKTAE